MDLLLYSFFYFFLLLVSGCMEVSMVSVMLVFSLLLLEESLGRAAPASLVSRWAVHLERAISCSRAWICRDCCCSVWARARAAFIGRQVGMSVGCQWAEAQ